MMTNNKPESNEPRAPKERSLPFFWFTGEWPATIRALRHPNFRYFWFGQLISLIGTWMQSTAQGWLIYLLAKTEYGVANAAFYVGVIGALGSTPMFLLTLFAGVIADRYDRRRILILTQTILMILAAVLAFLVGIGHIRLWHVAVFTVLSGLTMAFDMPTRQAFVKDMAAPEDLLNAIALNSSIFNLARIIGPGIAGALMAIAWIGVPGVLYANAASYIAVIAGLLMIRVKTVTRQTNGNSMWQNLLEGFRYVIRQPIIRLLMLMMAIYSVFGFSYGFMQSVIADQLFNLHHKSGLSEHIYSMLLVAGGIGAFAGAIFLATSANSVRKGRVLLFGGLSFTLSLIGFSFSRHLWLSLALLLCVGGGFVVSSAAINSVIQEIVPDALRGRVVSIWAFIFAGFMPVGALYAGFMARLKLYPDTWHLSGPTFPLLIGGTICLMFIMAISLRFRWLWQVS